MNQNITPLKKSPLLSICIPAYNEEGNIQRTLDSVSAVLVSNGIPHEFVIANDNSKDGTEAVIKQAMQAGIPIRLINRVPPGGFGRAVRTCLDHFKGEIVIIVMADLSDDPNDIVRYYTTINQGYDAVFGSRFMKGSVVKDYPRVKLVANRIGNNLLKLLFRTEHNDLTNSFKAFRAQAIRSILPLYSAHFNLTIEISLGLLVRRFKIARIPINWYGRTWGRANFKIAELGRRYLATLCKVYAEKIFIHDDLIGEHQVKLQQVSGSKPTQLEVITNIPDLTIKQEESINEAYTDNGRSRLRGI
jgi:dolichol-phosphate mannosyltransferase